MIDAKERLILKRQPFEQERSAATAPAMSAARTVPVARIAPFNTANEVTPVNARYQDVDIDMYDVPLSPSPPPSPLDSPPPTPPPIQQSLQRLQPQSLAQPIQPQSDEDEAMNVRENNVRERNKRRREDDLHEVGGMSEKQRAIRPYDKSSERMNNTIAVASKKKHKVRDLNHIRKLERVKVASERQKKRMDRNDALRGSIKKNINGIILSPDDFDDNGNYRGAKPKRRKVEISIEQFKKSKYRGRNVKVRPNVHGHGLECKFIPYSENIVYEYYDNPNELCDRLKLLLPSKKAGNTNHNQEINSIIDELRERNIIE